MSKNRLQQGFSLIELMVAMVLGLIVSYAILEVYLTQSQLYKTSHSQSLILSTENALVSLLTPPLRSAGHLGCGSVNTAVSNLNAGLPDPLGSINTNPSMIRGYSGSNSSINISQNNPDNDNKAEHWSPALPSSLVGQTIKGSDVLIVLGATPGAYSVNIEDISLGSESLTLQSTSGLSIEAGQLGAVSDGAKSIIFQITGVAGTTLFHSAGGGSMPNANASFPVSFSKGAQFIPVQQIAFFVAHGPGNQSGLMKAVLNGSTWSIEPLVPGIELMKIQYGIGSDGLISQYVSANAVTDWSKVYALRLGFLISGKTGSAHPKRNFTVLDTLVTVPNDTLLRHTFEMSIHLRNSL